MLLRVLAGDNDNMNIPDWQLTLEPFNVIIIIYIYVLGFIRITEHVIHMWIEAQNVSFMKKKFYILYFILQITYYLLYIIYNIIDVHALLA